MILCFMSKIALTTMSHDQVESSTILPGITIPESLISP
jgi:hypothetical protein